eukprot:SAG11_NODE_319_length_10822_cov_12.319500_4_plen_269_part_00
MKWNVATVARSAVVVRKKQLAGPQAAPITQKGPPRALSAEAHSRLYESGVRAMEEKTTRQEKEKARIAALQLPRHPEPISDDLMHRLYSQVSMLTVILTLTLTLISIHLCLCLCLLYICNFIYYEKRERRSGSQTCSPLYGAGGGRAPEEAPSRAACSTGFPRRSGEAAATGAARAAAALSSPPQLHAAAAIRQPRPWRRARVAAATRGINGTSDGLAQDLGLRCLAAQPRCNCQRRPRRDQVTLAPRRVSTTAPTLSVAPLEQAFCR